MNPIVQLLLTFYYITWGYMISLYRLVVPVPRKNICNQVVLVTGGGRGIGRCLAPEFSKQGAKVAILDINQEMAEETAEMIKAEGRKACAYKCDVTNYDEVKQVASEVKRDLGDVDILVNNAGVLVCKGIQSLSQAEIQRTFNVNIISHFWTIKEFLPAMVEKNEGHIVSIASMAGKAGDAYLTDYCATKFAVVGLTESLQAEMKRFGKDGIKTTIVCPMFTNTNLTRGIEDRMVGKTGLGMDKFYEPEEVAEATIDGALRNSPYVYIPKSCGLIDFVKGVFPLKTLQKVGEITNMGFYPADQPPKQD